MNLPRQLQPQPLGQRMQQLATATWAGTSQGRHTMSQARPPVPMAQLMPGQHKLTASMAAINPNILSAAAAAYLPYLPYSPATVQQSCELSNALPLTCSLRQPTRLSSTYTLLCTATGYLTTNVHVNSNLTVTVLAARLCRQHWLTHVPAAPLCYVLLEPSALTVSRHESFMKFQPAGMQLVAER
jgi:hypothetical protein